MNLDFEITELLSGIITLKTKKGRIKKKNLALISRKNDRKTRKALKEIEEKRNHSWFEEIYERNKNRLDAIALSYRGNDITYGEMFENMRALAKSLKKYGIKKGDEIPICLGNTPELIYLMGAASILGAKVNIFGSKFDKDYISKILNDTHSRIAFIEDNYYEKLKNSIGESNVKDVVLISLADSLKNGIHPYDKGKNDARFTSKVEKFKNNNENVKSFFDFKNYGTDYLGVLLEKVGLDDEFSITYTSGSTNAKYPKQIVHDNRSFIMMGRHHDKDMSGGIDMSKFTFLAHLPTYSNTDLISCISDSLMQGSKIALEPISDIDFFIYSLLIYQPHCAIETTSYIIHAMKEVMYNPIFDDVVFPNLFLLFGAGEPTSVNEEFFCNRGLQKAKAGCNIIPSCLQKVIKSIVMSTGGGDCEHGSIFYGIFRRLYERKIAPNYYEEAGNKVSDFAEVAVLDNDGYYCSKGEYGRIVANSGCSMEYYKGDPDATSKFFIKDAYGKTWGDCNVYGFIDNRNRVHVKGRIPSEGEKLPTFLINDEVLRDQINVLSSATVKVVDNGEEYYVVHFEKMPESKEESRDIMKNALLRIHKVFGEDVSSHVLFRERSFKESFPLTGSGKRDLNACKLEGISEKTVHIDLEEITSKELKKVV